MINSKEAKARIKINKLLETVLSLSIEQVTASQTPVETWQERSTNRLKT